MIATSVLFLAAAIATFLVGVFSTGLQMIGASIGCSVAAAVLLLVGVMRDSRKRPAIAPSGFAVSSPDVETLVAPSLPDEMEKEPVATMGTEAASTSALDLGEARDEFFGSPATASYEPAPTAPKRGARKPAARKPAARKPAAKKAAPKKAAAKKAAPKKATARKPAAKKSAPRKPAARKPSPGTGA